MCYKLKSMNVKLSLSHVLIYIFQTGSCLSYPPFNPSPTLLFSGLILPSLMVVDFFFLILENKICAWCISNKLKCVERGLYGTNSLNSPTNFCVFVQKSTTHYRLSPHKPTPWSELINNSISRVPV